jgi:hypothetical protein
MGTPSHLRFQPIGISYVTFADWAIAGFGNENPAAIAVELAPATKLRRVKFGENDMGNPFAVR